MALDKIGIFHKDIYQLLKSNIFLSGHLKNVYLNIQKDALLPYILVNLLTVKNISIIGQYSYEIEFEILLFTKDKNQIKILTIADYIIDLLKRETINSKIYNLVGLKFTRAEWNRGNDPSLTKISLMYKGLINGR